MPAVGIDTNAFVLERREVVEAAMSAYAAGKAGFSDHVILEAARAKGAAQTFTFDRALARAPGAALMPRPIR